MNLAEVGFRMFSKNKIAGWSFNGEWTKEEKTRVEAVISQYVKPLNDTMFNNWTFSKYGDVYLGRRASWEMGSLGGTLDKLLSDIEAYYLR